MKNVEAAPPTRLNLSPLSGPADQDFWRRALANPNRRCSPTHEKKGHADNGTCVLIS